MKKLRNSRGSILIWTMLLGLSLATVFFFFSQRLNANASSQRETMEYLNSKIFMESYVDYIQGLTPADLKTIRGDIDYEGITGALTNVVEEITGVVDAGDTVTYSATYTDPGDKILIMWDACPLSATELLNVTNISVAPTPGGCILPDPTYEMMDGEITASPFSLTATAGPVSYKLVKSGDKTVLYDNKWQLDIEMSLGFRKKLTANRIFTP